MDLSAIESAFSEAKRKLEAEQEKHQQNIKQQQAKLDAREKELNDREKAIEKLLKEGEDKLEKEKTKLMSEWNWVKKTTGLSVRTSVSDEPVPSMEDTNSFPSVIELNVGGKSFHTTLATLRNGESMLSAMFSGRHPMLKDKNGSYFLDRDPTSFSYVLNFLRRNEWNLPDDSFIQNEVTHEAHYFGLSSPSPIVPTWSSSPCTSHTISNSFHTASLIEGQYGCLLSSDGYTCGIHKWKLRLISRLSTCMVGVAPSTVCKSGAPNHNKNGYYINLNGGALYSGPPMSKNAVAHFSGGAGTGSIVTVSLNCDAHTLSFDVDGKSYGLAYENLPLVPLFLAWDNNTTAGSEIELI